MSKLSEITYRKFEDIIDVTEWEIETDTGWVPIASVNKTIPYEKWRIETSETFLESADNHILFDENMNEIFVKDLSIGDKIQTKNGLQEITLCKNLDIIENMFDLSLSDDHHRYYSNGILSHNTITAAGYLLWYASFNPDSTILIAAHIFAGASEVMNRIRFMYESLPDFLRPGIIEYNKQSISFDNGSRIVARATTPTTGRGLSISCLSTNNTMVTVRDKITGEISTISIRKLIDKQRN